MTFPIETPVAVPAAGPEWMHSIVTGCPHGVPEPARPHSPEFELEAETFLQVRRDVTAGVWPSWYFADLGIDPEPPAMFAQFGVVESDPWAAAQLVNHSMDHPLDLHGVFMQQVGGIPELKVGQADRSPITAGVDFLGARAFDAAVAHAISEALTAGFQVKYHYGLVRPEHHFDAGVLVAEYECPPHHAYVAGHSVIDGATFEMWATRVNLDAETLAAFDHAARQHGHYRTLAGVHWPQDNEAGFELGRQIVRERFG